MVKSAQEFRNGWKPLLASVTGAGTGVAPMAAYSIGALVGPLSSAFGWSRSQITASTLFSAIGLVVASTLAGALADRYGARRVAIFSQILLVAGLAAMSLVSSHIWTLYAAYLLLAIIGAGTLPMVWGRAIVGWFSQSRGLALGMSLVGTGLVGTLLPSYVSWLAADFGWRNAYLGMAALPLIFALPLTIMFFREPSSRKADEGQQAVVSLEATAESGYSVREAVSTLCIWQMSLSFLLVAGSVSAVLTNIISLLADRGIDRVSAAALSGIFGLAVIAGRLIGGYLLDKFNANTVAAGLFSISGLACFMLLLAGSDQTICGLAIALIGLAAGAEYDIAAFLTARYFGRLHYGAIAGICYTVISIGGGLGPAAFSALSEAGSSDLPLIGCTASILMAALLILVLRAPEPRAQSSL
jgi:MFS family permease